jgi:hypothetical protein
MIGQAVRAGVPFARVAGDEVCGGNPRLRSWLEEQQMSYVLAGACDEMIATAAGPRRADELAALVPAAAWQQPSCADGSKRPRMDDWALTGVPSGDHRLLVRWSAPQRQGRAGAGVLLVLLAAPGRAARAGGCRRARRAVEDCFAETCLDQNQVRS